MKTWFENQNSQRHSSKETVLEEAIRQGRSGNIKSGDEEITAFWHFYEAIATDYPDLEFTVNGMPASGNKWFRFNPTLLSDDATIIHKAGRGIVDLTLNGRGPKLGKLRKSVVNKLADDMSVHQTGKSAAIRIEVPEINNLSSPEAKQEAIRESLEAANRLLTWEQENRELWQEVPSSN